VEEDLSDLHLHLTTLEHLHEQYVAYRMAFNKLLLEIARRRQYKEAAENIVQGMMRQLESMSEGMVCSCRFRRNLFNKILRHLI
jgi:autophagy-related protein 17